MRIDHLKNHLLLLAVLTLTTPLSAEESGQNHNEHAVESPHHNHGDEHDINKANHEEGQDHHEESGSAELTAAQQRTAEIQTDVAEQKRLALTITAPGKVIFNPYRSSKITPRIAAQVVERHVQLGDHVEKGQTLITLSSVEMATAQGELIEANAELKRVKKLGRKVLSEKRYLSAKIDYQQAYAKVSAYGMSKTGIEKWLRKKEVNQAIGQFELLSHQEGTVINDNFVIGELVQAGQTLYEISDEKSLWVEAHLTPKEATEVVIGAKASIQIEGQHFSGRVTHTRHTLDEVTRTLTVQIEVNNPDEQLHPGQFVTAAIESQQQQSGIVVPLAAVLRSPDGDWQLFVEESSGHFEGREVEILSEFGQQLLIKGVEAGATIVTHGAFFIQSEIAKSGFEVHNH